MAHTVKTIQNKIKNAKQLSAEHGVRWSEIREEVYKTLLGHEKPVTAYQLLDEISKNRGKDVKPASIYRSLDALCELGVAVRIESLNAFLPCQHPEDHHEHVFMVCKQCGSADEIADHSVSKQLKKDAANQGFSIERQVLELHGSCKDCKD